MLAGPTCHFVGFVIRWLIFSTFVQVSYTYLTYKLCAFTSCFGLVPPGSDVLSFGITVDLISLCVVFFGSSSMVFCDDFCNW